MKEGVKMMLVLLAGLGLCACATKIQRPEVQIGQANTAVSAAESAGAYDAAPVELQAARDKLTLANLALRQEDNLKAQRLAEEALADATLAQAKARTAKSNKSEESLHEGIQILQEEVNLKSAH